MKCSSIISKLCHQHLICKCFFLLSVLFIFYIYFDSSKMPENSKTPDNSKMPVTCYNENYFGDHIELLEDVLESKLQPKFGKSIFFHETSCRNGMVSINARQACAIESAARTNPNTDIFLLLASPAGFVKNETKPPIVEAILSYENVRMRNLNLWTYVKDTPLNAFLNTNKIFESKYLTSHLSDLLRYVSLFKWGGTYLDLDVIVKRNLNHYENYAGAESEDTVAAGMMNFNIDRIGSQIALECLQDFEKHFEGQAWGTNGPGVITRVLNEKCKSTSTSMMTRDHCHGFLVLNTSSVYAVGYNNWKYFFDEHHTDYVLNVTNDSIAVHLWNKLSASKTVRVGSNTAYGLLAKDYCPRVYGSCGDYF